MEGKFHGRSGESTSNGAGSDKGERPGHPRLRAREDRADRQGPPSAASADQVEGHGHPSDEIGPARMTKSPVILPRHRSLELAVRHADAAAQGVNEAG